MSFRNEEKLRIASGKIFDLKNWINKNEGETLFPQRTINTIYFDNIEYSMYYNSIEGVLPRKKIRVRNYNKEFDFNGATNHEVKISSVEGRFKTSKKISNLNSVLKLGLFDQNYGLCNPVLNVCYKRSYYKIKNIRLTLDENITYKRILSNNISKFTTYDNFNIVELKYNSNRSINYVKESFPFERARFSKYCRGVEFLKFNYCNEL